MRGLQRKDHRIQPSGYEATGRRIGALMALTIAAMLLVGGEAQAGKRSSGSGTTTTTFRAPYPATELRYYEGTSGTAVTPAPSVASANATTGAIHLALVSDSSACELLPSFFVFVNCIEGTRQAHVGFKGMSVKPSSARSLTAKATFHIASASWSSDVPLAVFPANGKAFAEAWVEASGAGVSGGSTACNAYVVQSTAPGPNSRSNEDVTISCPVSANGQGSINFLVEIAGYVAPGVENDYRLDLDATLTSLVIS